MLTDSKLIVPVPSWLQLSEQHTPILPGLVANISHLHPHLNDSPHSSCSLPQKEGRFTLDRKADYKKSDETLHELPRGVVVPAPADPHSQRMGSEH